MRSSGGMKTYRPQPGSTVATPIARRTSTPTKSEFHKAILDLLAKEKQETDAADTPRKWPERQRVADLNERLQDELHRLKIAGIQDEYQREWQSIQATYDEKVRAAEKSGADIELIEMARRERLTQLNRKQEEKEAAETKRFQEDLFRTETDLQDEIDRLKIDTDKTLTPEEKARQQMELRHANELRALRASGMDDVKNMDLLFQKQDLEAKQLAMAEQMPKRCGSRWPARSMPRWSAVWPVATSLTASPRRPKARRRIWTNS